MTIRWGRLIWFIVRVGICIFLSLWAREVLIEEYVLDPGDDPWYILLIIPWGLVFGYVFGLSRFLESDAVENTSDALERGLLVELLSGGSGNVTGIIGIILFALVILLGWIVGLFDMIVSFFHCFSAD